MVNRAVLTIAAVLAVTAVALTYLASQFSVDTGAIYGGF